MPSLTFFKSKNSSGTDIPNQLSRFVSQALVTAYGSKSGMDLRVILSNSL